MPRGRCHSRRRPDSLTQCAVLRSPLPSATFPKVFGRRRCAGGLQQHGLRAQRSSRRAGARSAQRRLCQSRKRRTCLSPDPRGSRGSNPLSPPSRCDMGPISRTPRTATSTGGPLLPGGARGCGSGGGWARTMPVRFAATQAQLRACSPLNPRKSALFDAMRIRLLTRAIAAIRPSTNGAVLPAPVSCARSSACQSAARWSYSRIGKLAATTSSI